MRVLAMHFKHDLQELVVMHLLLLCHSAGWVDARTRTRTTSARFCKQAWQREHTLICSIAGTATGPAAAGQDLCTTAWRRRMTLRASHSSRRQP